MDGLCIGAREITPPPRPRRHAEEGPIFHKLDETIAPMLKKAWEDRDRRPQFAASWTDIIADLNSLTETEIEQEGKRFIVRSPPGPAARLAIRAAMALAPTVRPAING